MFTILLGLLELTRPLVLLAQHQSSLDNALTYRLQVTGNCHLVPN